MSERPETVSVGMRVSPERKREMEEFIEDHPEHQNLSDLLRSAVAHEMSEDYGPLPSTQITSVEETGDGVGEVATQVDQMRSELEDLTTTVAGLSREIQSDTPDTIMEATAALWDELPRQEANAVTVDELAKVFSDTEKAILSSGLHELRQDTGVVCRTDDGKWYREE